MNVQSLSSLAPIHGEASGGIGAKESGGGTEFKHLLGDLLGREAAASAHAEKAIEALATGQADNLHAVSLAVAQADLNFRLILELRNRLTEAYQDVMRMQV